MLKYEIVNLPKIAVIGREGFCTKEKNVVRDLWAQANSRFREVADLGMKNPDGSYVGFWGAMSDEAMAFLPWTDNLPGACIWQASRCMRIRRFRPGGSNGSCRPENIL